MGQGCCDTDSGSGCCSPGSQVPRGFLTKEEKVKMLKEYKETLEKEAKGVEEKIGDLSKN